MDMRSLIEPLDPGAEAGVGESLGGKFLNRGGIEGRAGRLPGGCALAALVPGKPQPLQVFHQLPSKGGLAADRVQVLDAQDYGAALAAGGEPGQEEGEQVPQMHPPAGGWGKPAFNGHFLCHLTATSKNH